jgi:hypothetical protein
MIINTKNFIDKIKNLKQNDFNKYRSFHKFINREDYQNKIKLYIKHKYLDEKLYYNILSYEGDLLLGIYNPMSFDINLVLKINDLKLFIFIKSNSLYIFNEIIFLTMKNNVKIMITSNIYVELFYGFITQKIISKLKEMEIKNNIININNKIENHNKYVNINDNYYKNIKIIKI